MGSERLNRQGAVRSAVVMVLSVWLVGVACTQKADTEPSQPPAFEIAKPQREALEQAKAVSTQLEEAAKQQQQMIDQQAAE